MKRLEGRWKGLTASVISLRPLLTFARARGLDTAALLAPLGLRASELGEIDRRISERCRQVLWREVAARCPDEAVGLVVPEFAQLGDYDVLDYALCHSATLHDAFGRMARFHRILCDAWAVTLEQRTDQLHVVRSIADLERPESEAFAALLLRRSRQVTGTAIKPRMVRFKHNRPKNVRPLSATFACPVQFRCAVAELCFDRRDLNLPLRNANSGLTKVLDRHMRDLLQRLPRLDDFEHSVHHAVAKALHGGSTTLAATARALRTSTRTVQRRLHDLGTSHRQVVDSVRRELAERLVADQRLSITEIAFLTGFSDVSGFRRTFTRWNGASPAAVRARMR